ncbi:MAG: choline/ethanolamine kinase family protein [Oscillospiraceae bacterium]
MPTYIQEKRISHIAHKLGWTREKLIVEKTELGNTNTSFLCQYGKEKYVFRIGTTLTDKISINRVNELKSIKMLAGAQFSFDLVFFDETTGDMVSRYIEGQGITPDIYSTDKFIEDVSTVLRQIHGCKAEYAFLPLSDIEKRISLVMTNKTALGEDFTLAYKHYSKISKKYTVGDESSQFIGFCHNDTYLSNFKYDAQGKLHLLDYEFSGMGDVFFDIACIAQTPFGKLSRDKRQRLI